MNPSDEAYHFEAVKVHLRQDKDGWKLLLAIHPSEIPESMIRDWVGQRYVVALVPIGEDDKPIPKITYKAVDTGGKSEHVHDEAVRLAGMLCRDRSFQEWLGVASEDEAAECLKEWCGIKSRSELATSPEARELFRDYYQQYRHHISGTD